MIANLSQNQSNLEAEFNLLKQSLDESRDLLEEKDKNLKAKEQNIKYLKDLINKSDEESKKAAKQYEELQDANKKLVSSRFLNLPFYYLY